MTKLFCLPYAGSSSSMYSHWQKMLAPSIELIPLELPGRGKKIREILKDTVQETVDDIYEEVSAIAKKNEYAIFGHSLGALLAFELAHKLRQNKIQKPKHIFFSGSRAPDIKSDMNKHKLNNNEFTAFLKTFGGTPPTIFNDPEVMNFFLPIIKSDFEKAETYNYKQQIKPFDNDITILLGTEDIFSKDQIAAWKKHTSQKITIQYFNGDHFFINKVTKDAINLINEKLN